MYPATTAKKQKLKTSALPPSVNLLLEKHGILAIVDGTGNLVLSLNTKCYQEATLDSQNTFPKQSTDFHLANSMASTLYQVGGQLETLMGELDMMAAGHFDEALAVTPFLKVEDSME